MCVYGGYEFAQRSVTTAKLVGAFEETIEILKGMPELEEYGISMDYFSEQGSK